MFGKEKNVKVVEIDGMHCIHCAKKVEDTLKNVKEVKAVKIDLEQKTAEVTLKSEVSNEVIKETIEGLGYTVTNIK